MKLMDFKSQLLASGFGVYHSRKDFDETLLAYKTSFLGQSLRGISRNNFYPQPDFRLLHSSV